jgi:hypothetical protein
MGLLAAFAAFLPLAATPAETLVIRSSTTLSPGVRLLPSPGDERGPGALLIQGDGITVDFGGAVFRGTPETAEPNERGGVGIEVRGRNVTIRNARVHGYKVGLIARDAPGLKIVDSDFSYNWKQRLKSTLEREDLADWMSYHHNEKDEWLRYGAGIYLRNCDGFEVRNTRVTGGQNGLMITHTDRGLAWNNDFSFNSSLGIGMYRASHNRIMHNRIDWNVRGYSHGRWNRGQDSAGILVFEQCLHNVFAYNSVTHGGDGFFLWAGQTTMDTGQGGSNDNLLFANDFSHAPTNGIEATFSRNAFVNNLILECWHGIWGGYSYESTVIGNAFGLNAQAIAWEHGYDNLIANNNFDRDTEAIHLWAKEKEDPNWGYPKFRDTRSRDWTIHGNVFSNVFGPVLRTQRTERLLFRDNLIDGARALHVDQGGNAGHDFRFNTARRVPFQTLPGRGNVVGLDSEFMPLAPMMHPSGNVVQEPWADTDRYLARFDVFWSPYGGVSFSGIGGDPLRARQMLNAIGGSSHRVARLPGGIDPFIPQGQLRGRRYILIDEWGPYDFRRPIFWPRGEIASASSVAIDADGKQVGPHRTSTHRFEILGPKGTWRAVTTDGARLNRSEGTVPDLVEVTFDGSNPNVRIVLEFVGEETVDYRGVVTPAGRAVRFGYERFFLPIDWQVSWWAWDPAKVADPKKGMPPLREVVSGEPLRTERTDRLDYAWPGSPGSPVPANQFATLAEGTFEAPPGEYVLRVTTDDGIRVWVDERLVIDQWHWQGPTDYAADLKLGGRHRIRVEHYEIDGYAALKVELVPRR